MFKRRYFLQLELNKGNHMIFAINEDKGGYNEVIGFLFLEDSKRPGTAKDFSFLDPVLLKDWDDERNLIIVNVITFESLSDDEKKDLLFLASTMVEFKPAVNHKVEFIHSKSFQSFCKAYWEEYYMSSNLPIYEYLIEHFSENRIDISELATDSLNNLTQ